MKNHPVYARVWIIFVLTVSFNYVNIYADIIKGHVYDAETQEPLIGTNIFLTKTKLGASTDINGEYIINGIPSGIYDLQISYIGFYSVVIQNIKVSSRGSFNRSLGKIITIDVYLKQYDDYNNHEIIFTNFINGETIYNSSNLLSSQNGKELLSVNLENFLNTLERDKETNNNKSDISPKTEFKIENPVNKIVNTDFQGPSIIITSLDTVSNKVPEYLVEGYAKDISGINRVLVNDKDANLYSDGHFIASEKVNLSVGNNVVKIEAIDIYENSTSKSFNILRENPRPFSDESNVIKGKYYALIIAAENYTHSSVGKLDHPIKDAQKLRDVLINHYNFEKQNVYTLFDPDRKTIINKFFELENSRVITGEDNFLIFFSGHGSYNENQEEGYWVPINASWEDPSELIMNSRVQKFMRAIKAKHVLLITDACFSGSIFTVKTLSKNKAISKLYGDKSRRAITSGNLTRVPDNGIFIDYIVMKLNQNTQLYLNSQTLFSEILEPVANNSSNNPKQGVVFNSGDEGGDFIFLRKMP